jgi:hypothetical protein
MNRCDKSGRNGKCNNSLVPGLNIQFLDIFDGIKS